MTTPENIQLERRTMDSPHTHCTAHSGMNARLTLNLVMNGVGIVLLSVLLNVAIGIRADLAVGSSERANLRANLVHLEKEVDKLKEFVHGGYGR